MTNHYTCYHPTDPQLLNIDEDIMNMSDKIFSSIARHIRKKFIKKHIPCLKHLTRNYGDVKREDICPYAYAYAFWRNFSQRFKSIENVDNYGYPPFYRGSREDFYLPTIHEYNFLLDAISDWEGLVKTISLPTNDKNREGIKWIVSKCLEKTILLDFYVCLEITKKHVMDNFQFNQREYFKPEKLPQLFILKKELEIHIENCSDSTFEEVTEELTKEFICPNNTVKKRRGPKTTYRKPNPLEFLNR